MIAVFPINEYKARVHCRRHRRYRFCRYALVRVDRHRYEFRRVRVQQVPRQDRSRDPAVQRVRTIDVTERDRTVVNVIRSYKKCAEATVTPFSVTLFKVVPCFALPQVALFSGGWLHVAASTTATLPFGDVRDWPFLYRQYIYFKFVNVSRLVRNE